MANTVFLQLIEDKLGTLTKSEKKIAEYILEHPNRVVDATITELAERIGTSDASIVRSCNLFGCKGYQNFKIRLAREVVPHYKQLNVALEQHDTALTICQKIFNTEIATLHETLEMLNVEHLQTMAQRIREADYIEIFGSGGSSVVAQDIRHKFLKVGIRCTVLLDADIQAMSASLLKKGDVAIGISHTGSTKSVFHCLKMARKNGAYVILLTTQAKSPIGRIADLVIPVGSKETLFKSESTSARIAELVVMDAVLALAVSDDYKKYNVKITKTRDATSENKF